MSLFVKVVSTQVNISNILLFVNLQMKKNGNNVKIEKPRKNLTQIKALSEWKCPATKDCTISLPVAIPLIFLKIIDGMSYNVKN